MALLGAVWLGLELVQHPHMQQHAHPGRELAHVVGVILTEDDTPAAPKAG